MKEDLVKIILNENIGTQDLIDLSKYIIDLLDSKRIYKYKNAGEILNNYVRHTVKRIIDKDYLISLYLLCLSKIYLFICKEKNKDFLDNAGLTVEDRSIIKRIIYTSIKKDIWRKIILKELNVANQEEFNDLIRICKMCNLDIWKDIYTKSEKSEELNWRYFSYLIELGNLEQRKLALDLFLNKADSVNIIYPINNCNEYISIIRLLKSNCERNSTYEEIVKFGVSSNNIDIFLNSIKVIKDWGKDLYKLVNKDKIEEFLKLKDLKKEALDELLEVKRELSNKGGFYIEF